MTTNCVLLNEQGEYVNLIVVDDYDPTRKLPDGFTLLEVPEGYTWNGKKVVSFAEAFQTNVQVTPEVI